MTEHQPNLLVGIHIAKTGGATFATILERAATGMYCQYYGPDHPATGLRLEGVEVTPLDDTPTLSLFDRMLTVPSIGARRNVLQGHLGASRTMDRYPGADFAVWLRDPIDRVLSHYTFWKRLASDFFDDPLFRRLHDENITVEEFAAAPRVRNTQTRATGGRPIEDFAFVGITEQYERGLDLFGRMYEVDAAEVVTLNTNPDRAGAGYDIADDTREVLTSYNQKDLALYRQAVGRFEALDAATPRPRSRRRPRAAGENG